MAPAKSTKYDLIVFDWDGTLMDSAARIVACMQLAAKDINQPIPTPAAARDVIGLGLDRAMEIVFPGVSPNQVEMLVEAYRKHWLSNDIAASSLFAGAEECVKALSETGYLLAVATGKSRRGLDKVMAETNLTALFHVTRCADETFSKPHPQMLNEILVDLNTGPERAIVIGDSEYDMQMAANAKVDAVGVSHGVHDAERLVEHGALQIFDGLNQLPHWLFSQRI